MDFHYMYDLPHWEDDRLREIDAADDLEAWKPNPTRDACKNAYKQWKQVVYYLNCALSSVVDTPASYIGKTAPATDLISSISGMMMEDALQVAIKLKSSEVSNLYVCRMENAAVIRRCASAISAELLVLGANGGLDPSYVSIVRDEINTFRRYFKAWVATFERDEYVDEWGLF